MATLLILKLVRKILTLFGIELIEMIITEIMLTYCPMNHHFNPISNSIEKTYLRSLAINRV